MQGSCVETCCKDFGLICWILLPYKWWDSIVTWPEGWVNGKTDHCRARLAVGRGCQMGKEPAIPYPAMRGWVYSPAQILTQLVLRPSHMNWTNGFVLGAWELSFPSFHHARFPLLIAKLGGLGHYKMEKKILTRKKERCMRVGTEGREFRPTYKGAINSPQIFRVQLLTGCLSELVKHFDVFLWLKLCETLRFWLREGFWVQLPLSLASGLSLQLKTRLRQKCVDYLWFGPMQHNQTSHFFNPYFSGVREKIRRQFKRTPNGLFLHNLMI